MIAAVALPLVAIPLVAGIAATAAVAILLVLLIALIVYGTRLYGESRDRIRHEHRDPQES